MFLYAFEESVNNLQFVLQRQPTGGSIQILFVHVEPPDNSTILKPAQATLNPGCMGNNCQISK